MVSIYDLRLNRTPAYYLVEWDFEGLPRGEISYAVSIDDDTPMLNASRTLISKYGHHNLHEDYPKGYFFCAPEHYLRARFLNIWLYHGFAGLHKLECFERLRVLNSPALLPITRRYD